MAQISMFWTTTIGGVGHQVAGYTQAYWSTAAQIMAACAGFEGVAPGYGDELEGVVSAVNTVNIGAGGAVVDGKVYHNDATEQVNIPSATAGNTRIDRIVLRADWAGFKVALHRIAGTDAGSPVPPAITQTSGTTYDIMLYQATVTDAGVVTLTTDERVFAAGGTNSLSPNAVESAGIFVGSIRFTGIVLRLPAGWSAARNSVGDYTITHNLNLLSYLVIGTVHSYNAGDGYVCVNTTMDNTFQMYTMDGNGTLTDANFSFILLRYV